MPHWEICEMKVICIDKSVHFDNSALHQHTTTCVYMRIRNFDAIE
jgi:hypothetical protein